MSSFFSLCFRETLGSAGVSDGDMLQLMPRQQLQQHPQPRQQQPAVGGGGNPMDRNPDGSAKNPAALISTILRDPHQMSMIAESNPQLAK